nr:desiccation-related protein pcc13-62 [Quercus suber]
MARPFLFCAFLFILTLEVSLLSFFLTGALGRGLDSFAPSFAKGDPPPIGARKAILDPLAAQIIEEFGYQEIGHLSLSRLLRLQFVD